MEMGMSQGQERKAEEGKEEVLSGVVRDVSGEVTGENKHGMMRTSSDVDVDFDEDGMANISVKEDVSVTQTDEEGATTTVSQTIGSQFMGPAETMTSPAMFLVGGKLTIGEALQAAAITAGHKAVDQTDAAAIKAAEKRALGGGGGGTAAAGGIGALAEAAAERNKLSASQGTKATLSDVLAEVNEKLRRDKSVTREDAEAVAAAEVRDGPNDKTTPHGIAASMAAADQLNTSPSI